jgi:hypothetical protein
MFGTRTEDTFQHLFWYLNCVPCPRGKLEVSFGPAFSPRALYDELAASNTATLQATAASNTATLQATRNTVRLATLINYVEEEIRHKEFKRRVKFWQASGCQDTRVLVGCNCNGQDAIDAYVSQLVAALRDFPYTELRTRHLGILIRDEVVAPCFQGRWNFYNNKKVGEGFSLESLVAMFYTLVDRLRKHELREDRCVSA